MPERRVRPWHGRMLGAVAVCAVVCGCAPAPPIAPPPKLPVVAHTDAASLLQAAAGAARTELIFADARGGRVSVSVILEAIRSAEPGIRSETLAPGLLAFTDGEAIERTPGRLAPGVVYVTRRADRIIVVAVGADGVIHWRDISRAGSQ